MDRLTTTIEKIEFTSSPLDIGERIGQALREVPYLWQTSVPLTTVLAHVGFDAALWALRATVEDASVFSRLLAADFVEHALVYFERDFPLDSRPRQAVQVARAYASGLVTKQELRLAHVASAEAGLDLLALVSNGYHRLLVPMDVALATAEVATPEHISELPWGLSGLTAGIVARAVSGVHADRDEANLELWFASWRAEITWQRACFLDCLQGQEG